MYEISKDLVALFANRTLMRFSLGILGVFLPIFFYQTFNENIAPVVAIYISLSALYVLIVPFSARLLARAGVRKLMLFGVFIAALSALALYFFETNPAYAAVYFVLLTVLYRVLYWVPYHVDFSLLLNKKKGYVGRQTALLANIASVVLLIVPIVGGLVIDSFGFKSVFAASVVIMLLAAIPLFFMHTAYEHYSWDFIDTFQHLFAKQNRKLLLAHASAGAEGAVILVFWPLYLFAVVQGNYTTLGTITAATMLIVLVLRSFAGKLLDKVGPKKMLVASTVLVTTGWLAKIFVATPLQAFSVHTYHDMGRKVNITIFDATTYEQAADNGRFIDEYTTLKEIALHLGRALMLLVVAVLLAFFDMRVAFALAALSALAMILLSEYNRVS